MADDAGDPAGKPEQLQSPMKRTRISRLLRLVLELTALIGAYKQREDLAVVASVLAALLQSAEEFQPHRLTDR